MSGLLATIHSFLPQFHLIFTPDPSFSLLLSLNPPQRRLQRLGVFLPDFTFWDTFLEHFLGHHFSRLLSLSATQPPPGLGVISGSPPSQGTPFPELSLRHSTTTHCCTMHCTFLSCKLHCIVISIHRIRTSC